MERGVAIRNYTLMRIGELRWVNAEMEFVTTLCTINDAFTEDCVAAVH